jgi:4-oxalocrotonate tautomerase
VTAIAIDYIDPEDWIVGGKPLSEQNKSSVYFDIKITDETNTKSEKARYIREAFAANR